MASPSPAARSLLAQMNKRWPKRHTGSDGIMPSAAHHRANPRSDHETGNAVDITRDDRYYDSMALARGFTKDRRCKYVIHRGRIWSRTFAWLGFRKYTGSNPHSGHVHVSIVAKYRSDDGAWPGLGPRPPAVSKNVTRTKDGGKPASTPLLKDNLRDTIVTLPHGTQVDVLKAMRGFSEVRAHLSGGRTFVGWVDSDHIR